MELINVRVTELNQTDVMLSEPGVERCGVPGLGAYTNDGVLLVHQ
jgi:hypothetical protein